MVVRVPEVTANKARTTDTARGMDRATAAKGRTTVVMAIRLRARVAKVRMMVARARKVALPTATRAMDVAAGVLAQGRSPPPLTQTAVRRAEAPKSMPLHLYAACPISAEAMTVRVRRLPRPPHRPETAAIHRR